MAKHDEPFLTVGEVAAIVRLSPKTVYRAISMGQLEGVKLCGRYLIHPAALDAWLSASRVVQRSTEPGFIPAVPAAAGSLAALRRIEADAA